MERREQMEQMSLAFARTTGGWHPDRSAPGCHHDQWRTTSEIEVDWSELLCHKGRYVLDEGKARWAL